MQIRNVEFNSKSKLSHCARKILFFGIFLKLEILFGKVINSYG